MLTFYFYAIVAGYRDSNWSNLTGYFNPYNRNYTIIVLFLEGDPCVCHNGPSCVCRSFLRGKIHAGTWSTRESCNWGSNKGMERLITASLSVCSCNFMRKQKLLLRNAFQYCYCYYYHHHHRRRYCSCCCFIIMVFVTLLLLLMLLSFVLFLTPTITTLVILHTHVYIDMKVYTLRPR